MKDYSKVIREYLIEKENYTNSDDILIDEISYNFHLLEKCKEDILNEGYRVNVTKNPKKQPYWTKSQSLIVYFMCLKELKSLFVELGISPRERAKLGFNLKEYKDEFDEAFG